MTNYCVIKGKQQLTSLYPSRGKAVGKLFQCSTNWDYYFNLYSVWNELDKFEVIKIDPANKLLEASAINPKEDFSSLRRKKAIRYRHNMTQTLGVLDGKAIILNMGRGQFRDALMFETINSDYKRYNVTVIDTTTWQVASK